MTSYPGFGTRAVHAGQDPEQWEMNQMVPPISISTICKHVAPGKPKVHSYTRTGNPTRDSLETSLAALEDAKYCLTFSSGSAAISTVVEILKTGDHIVCSEDVYGGTLQLLRKVSVPHHGLEVSYIDLTKPGEIEKTMKKNTKLVWLESLSNPLLKVIDIAAVVAAVKKANPDALVVVDNTFMTPYFLRPLTLGVDVVVYSMTKYLNGHSDVLMGCVMTNREDVKDHLRFQQSAIGAVPSAFDCFLANRGLKTLHLRMKAHAENALAVATALEANDRVEKVLYPGLPSHPQHDLHAAQSKGSSGMIAFYLKGGEKETKTFFQAIKVFTLAESLGGPESLACVPIAMTHKCVAPEECVRLGIGHNLIRLSVGLEDKQDLIADLEYALKEAIPSI